MILYRIFVVEEENEEVAMKSEVDKYYSNVCKTRC